MAASISVSLNNMQALRSFHFLSEPLLIGGMKTIAEIRLDNLTLLIEEFGSQDEIARRAGTSPVYISQLINRTPDFKTGKPRQVGDPMARRVEAGCEKEVGWLDNRHPVLTYRQQRVAHVMQVMEEMEDWQVDQATKSIDTIAEAIPKRGNGGY